MNRCPKMTSRRVGKRASITPARTMPGESPSEDWSVVDVEPVIALKQPVSLDDVRATLAALSDGTLAHAGGDRRTIAVTP